MKALSFFYNILIVSTLVYVSMTYAQSKDVKPSNVTYEKKTKIDFEDRDVDGDFLTPEGQSVDAEKNLHFDSMLDPKDNFKKELKRSMGAVR